MRWASLCLFLLPSLIGPLITQADTPGDNPAPVQVREAAGAGELRARDRWCRLSHALGRGAPADAVSAYAGCEPAARAGLKEAIETRRDLRPALSAPQREQALELAIELQQQTH